MPGDHCPEDLRIKGHESPQTGTQNKQGTKNATKVNTSIAGTTNITADAKNRSLQKASTTEKCS